MPSDASLHSTPCSQGPVGRPERDYCPADPATLQEDGQTAVSVCRPSEILQALFLVQPPKNTSFCPPVSIQPVSDPCLIRPRKDTASRPTLSARNFFLLLSCLPATCPLPVPVLLLEQEWAPVPKVIPLSPPFFPHSEHLRVFSVSGSFGPMSVSQLVFISPETFLKITSKICSL